MTYKEFLKHVEDHPFKGNQEQCGTGNNYWNADYWTIEVARCLSFKDYILPERFKGNRFADPNRIKRDADIKISCRSILDNIKDSADVLLIAEVGRGLDILTANMVKKWDKIYCWDHVDYSNYLTIFDNIEFIHKPSSIMMDRIMMDEIKEKHIFIMNHSLYPPANFWNDNNVHSISDGGLLW